jgi:ABC-type uncharacterized transport system permease subunit
MATVIAVFAIIFYCLSTARQYQAIANRSVNHRKQVLMLGSLAVMLHGVSWLSQLSGHNGINFSFFNVGSLISLVIGIMILLSALKKPLENLFLGIFPMAASLLALNVFMGNDDNSHPINDSGLAVHIIFSIMAYSLLTIAAFQAILLMIQDRQLKHKHMNGIVRILPPLQTMNRLLFEMLAAGTLLLTIAIASGFIFLDDLFAQHLVHKTIFTLLAWLTFAALQLGHWRFGWRGNVASKWTLVGTGFLVLAYFGSKLVLEVILDKV